MSEYVVIICLDKLFGKKRILSLSRTAEHKFFGHLRTCFDLEIKLILRFLGVCDLTRSFMSPNTCGSQKLILFPITPSLSPIKYPRGTC